MSGFEMNEDLLRTFLQSWFHQDFDIEGGGWEDVIDAYLRTASDDERIALAAAIDEFREQPDADSAFYDRLSPDFDPAGIGLQPTAWLGEMQKRLLAALP
jgi:hypothetical protein